MVRTFFKNRSAKRIITAIEYVYYVYVLFFKNRSAKHVFTAIEYAYYAYVSFLKKNGTYYCD